MYDVSFYFIFFLFFSIVGWIAECISCTINTHKITYDRGFLLGPYCPVYGIGALYMYFTLDIFSYNPVSVFMVAMLGTSLLEYFTSYLMEIIFKARWWDYSDRKFNLAGRICLRNAIIFGIVGILFTYLLKPTYLDIINNVPSNILITSSIILFIIFAVDYIISFIATYKVRSGLIIALGDSTTEIDKKVKEILSRYRFRIRKMLKSFPDITIIIPGSDGIKKSLKKILDSMDLRKIIKYK